MSTLFLKLQKHNARLFNLATMFCLIFLVSCNQFLQSESKKFQGLVEKEKVEEVETLSTKLSIRYCPSQTSETVSENLLLIGVDFSGSNTGRSNGCFIGTDEKQKRLYEIIKFIKKQTINPGKSNLHIALVPFGDRGSVECYKIFGGKTRTYTEYNLTNPEDIANEKHEIYEILHRIIDDEAKPPGYNQFLPDSCMGWTNYLEALQGMTVIKNEFMKDMKAKYPANGDKKSMVFINGLFLSDGAPIVENGLQPDMQIFSNVYDFIYLHNDKTNSNIKNVFTFFSTGFYTAPFDPGPKYDSSCLIPSTNARTAIRSRCAKAKCSLSNGLSYTCGLAKPKVLCPKELIQSSCSVDGQEGFVKLNESIGSRLCDMSDIGGGSFFDLQNNPDYTDFKMTTFYNSYMSEKIIFQNKFSTWEQDSNGVKYTEDSDGDGLSNNLEKSMSSKTLTLDPLNADSDSDGIRDSLEFYLNPKIGVQNTLCPKDSHLIDTDLDGLNDCEEMILNLNPKNSDENLNKIPDGVDWKNRIQVTSTNSTNDLDGDGVTNIVELYENLPINVHNKFLPKNIIKQSESTVQDPANPACLITTIENFRITDQNAPTTVEFWYYAKQREGNLKHLLKGEFKLEFGEDKTIDAKDHLKGVSYEGQ